MDKIDLHAIQLRYITKEKGTVYPTKEQVSEMMKEAIHQALVLTTRKARVKYIKVPIVGDPRGAKMDIANGVDEQSILDVEKLII